MSASKEEVLQWINDLKSLVQGELDKKAGKEEMQQHLIQTVTNKATEVEMNLAKIVRESVLSKCDLTTSATAGCRPLKIWVI